MNFVNKQSLPCYLFGDSSKPQIIQPGNFKKREIITHHDSKGAYKSILKQNCQPKSNHSIKFAPQTFSKSKKMDQKHNKDTTRNKPPILELTNPLNNPADYNIHDSYFCQNLANSVSLDESHLSSFNRTFMPNQTAMFEDQSYWVRIFGVPNTHMKSILSPFSEYGVILMYKFASEGGNWLDIQYETKIDAMQALRKNGNIFLGNIMVGVMPILDGEVRDEQNFTNFDQSIIFDSKRHKAKVALQRSLAEREQKAMLCNPLLQFLSYLPDADTFSKILSYLF